MLKQLFSMPLGEDKYLIYAPLKRTAFIANLALINLIEERCQQVQTGDLPFPPLNPSLGFLDQINFFKPEPLPRDEWETKGIQYDSVILFLTNQCNLRCTYCYASSGDYPKKQMTWEIAKVAIDLVVNEVVKYHLPAMTLGFHGGGEPTLGWRILTQSTDYARQLAQEKGIPLHVTGSFNGCWSKKVRNYILTHFTEASLSFDGLPMVQNIQRPIVTGQDSASRVIETLHALDEAKFNYGIRMTVTNFSVNYLTESIAYLCENFKLRKIQIEPVFMAGRAKDNRSAITDPDVFIEQFIKAFRIAQQHNVEVFYSGARVEALTQRFCLAACRALVVTPEGNITTCFEIFGPEHPLSGQFLVGDYQGQGQFFIDSHKLSQHLSHTVENISFCENCFCKWHCAGDCAAKTYSESNSDRFEPSERCFVNQELTKFMILDNIKKKGGVIWNGNASH